MNHWMEQAFKYGKPDIERLGVFVEMSYLNGKGYVSPYGKPKRLKGISAIDSWNGEIPKQKPPPENLKKKKKKKPPYRPPGGNKMHSTPGDHYGTFSGPIKAFSGKCRKIPPKKREPKYFSTNPGKKGGYGYLDICLSEYPEHLDEPYMVKSKKEFKMLDGPMITAHCPQPYFEPNPFPEKNTKNLRLYVRPKTRIFPLINEDKWKPTGPAKWPGGCKAAGFDPYPPYMSDKCKKKRTKKKSDEYNGPYLKQSMGFKTLLTRSILTLGVDLSCNAVNFKTFEPSYTKRMLFPII
ncbi:hypothetical protein FQR65_LT00491 [Abscondita terminalis]|nr:hypothetical protein FQR65_LT00491 [Abscondita terminalis]